MRQVKLGTLLCKLLRKRRFLKVELVILVLKRAHCVSRVQNDQFFALNGLFRVLQLLSKLLNLMLQQNRAFLFFQRVLYILLLRTLSQDFLVGETLVEPSDFSLERLVALLVHLDGSNQIMSL